MQGPKIETLATGELGLWGFILSSPDMDPEELRRTFPLWMEQANETTSHIEKHDLLVESLVVSREGEGFSIRAVSADRTFENWDTGEIRESEESGSCFACGALIQWAEAGSGHQKGCPYLTVHEVMTR